MIVKKPEAELSLGKKLKGRKTDYYVLSSNGDKNLGGPYTLRQAKERLRQVEYFKRNPKSISPPNKEAASRAASRWGRGPFIRFGRWPEDEMSEIFYAYGDTRFTHEPGVSVYPAKWDEDKNRWAITCDNQLSVCEENAATRFAMSATDGVDIFLVEGDIVSLGVDFEPLIRNVEVISELSCKEICTPGYEHYFDMPEECDDTQEPNPRKQLYIKPNQAAVKAARKGLEARKAAPKSKKGGLSAMQAKEAGVGSGVMRARDIVAGKKVNAYQVKAFFDRHRQNYVDAKAKRLKPQESKAIQAWLLWGGEPLRKQAEAAVKKDRRQNPTVSGNGRRSRLREDKPVESVVANPMSDLQENPRPSKVKNALAAEAIRHSDFEEFAKKYWLDCARGIYWYATNDDRFKITDKELGLSKAKKFIVSCNPEFAFKGAANENKKYVAELNVNNLDAKDFEVVRGTDGNKIKIISNLDLVQITRIMDQDKSFRSWRYQQSILPSSKEQLKEFWKEAHRKHKIKEEKEAKRQKRLQRKEDKKLKKEVEKKYSAQPNPLAAGMQLPPRHHGPTVIEGKKAQYSYAGRDGDYDLYQTGNVMIGVIDMEIQEPEFDWKGAADRFYAYNTHSYHEGFAPSMEKALDKAFVGYPNPRVKNPGVLDMGPTDKHVTIGVREIPRYVNNPKY